VATVKSTSSDDDGKWTTRGAAAILERMTLDEWEALVAGEATSDDLREKYLGSTGSNRSDLQTRSEESFQ